MGETYERTTNADNTCPNCNHTGYMGVFQVSQLGSKLICPKCATKARTEEFKQ